MQRLLRTAIAAAAIGSILPAMADEVSPSPAAQLPEVIAQAPAQAIPPRGTAQTDIRSDHGAWLFPPIGKYLDQRARG